MSNKEKKSSKYEDLPERIDASPEEIAQAAFRRPFDIEWKYLKEEEEEEAVVEKENT